jgi:alpha-beta hydrolase superfamily lysophospholipase
MLFWILILFSVLALAWCGASFYLWVAQEGKYYPGNGAPFGMLAALAAQGGSPKEGSRDGQALRYYFFPEEKPRACFIHYHGNWGGADERADYARELKGLGLNVILAEYPGYAGDKSPTGEWPILRNALALYDEVRALDPSLPFFLSGESLGTGPATFVAGRRDCLGLILSTPYPSMADVAAFRYPLLPVKPLTTHPVRAELWARSVEAPVLILHGSADKTIPLAMGRLQALNFKNLKEMRVIQGAGHPDLRNYEGGLFWKQVRAFVEACFSAQ